jgi:hypothetical protein
MKSHIETRQYEFAHGRKPRGTGHWAFHPNFGVDSCSPEIFWFAGSWGDAKRAAAAHFGAQGKPVAFALS